MNKKRLHKSLFLREEDQKKGSVTVFVDYVGFYDDTIKNPGRGFGDDFDQDHDAVIFGVIYQF